MKEYTVVFAGEEMLENAEIFADSPAAAEKLLEQMGVEVLYIYPTREQL